jgi:hypothetical protein
MFTFVVYARACTALTFGAHVHTAHTPINVSTPPEVTKDDERLFAMANKHAQTQMCGEASTSSVMLDAHGRRSDHVTPERVVCSQTMRTCTRACR